MSTIKLRIRVADGDGAEATEEIDVNRELFLASAGSLGDTIDETQDTVDIDIGQPVPRSTVRIFTDALNDDVYPSFDVAMSFFTAEASLEEKLAHWNTAALLDYVGFVEYVGFYIVAFGSALRNFGIGWFDIHPPRDKKRKASSPGADMKENASKKQHTETPTTHAAALGACEACAKTAVGACTKCRAVLLCSAQCLHAIHEQCYAFLVVPAYTVILNDTFNLLSDSAAIRCVLPHILNAIINVANIDTDIDLEDILLRKTERFANTVDLYALLVNGPVPARYTRQYKNSKETYIDRDRFYYMLARAELTMLGKRGPRDPLRLLSPFVKLREKKWKPTYGTNWAIRAAVEGNRPEIVKELLVDKRVDPNISKGVLLRKAVEENYTEVVRLLLVDGRTYPPDEDGYWLMVSAVQISNMEIIRMLLDDPRVVMEKDTYLSGTVFAVAIKQDRPDLIKFLLAHKRTIISSEDFERAIQNTLDSVQTMDILLRDDRFNPNGDGSLAIKNACAFGYTAAVERLLLDPRVDPGVESNYCIMQASGGGHTDIVKLLLAHPRVDPNFSLRNLNNIYSAMVMAARNNRLEVIKLLLADPRVDPTADNYAALSTAKETRNIEAAQLIEDAIRAWCGMDARRGGVYRL